VPLTGSIIVSTPQQVALDDVIRGVKMFEKVQIPVLGVVENMAYFIPEDAPDKKYHIFGEGGARKMAEKLDVPFLGEIALVPSIREQADKGVPIILKDEFSDAGLSYKTVTNNMLNSLANRIQNLPPSKIIQPNNLPKT
jgi:ATP-binding protein involved in chromosome partitioning